MEDDTTSTNAESNVVDNENVSSTDMDSNFTSYIIGVSEEYSEMFNTLHSDLGIICSFLVLFSLVILFKYIYKFFNMFF